MSLVSGRRVFAALVGCALAGALLIAAASDATAQVGSGSVTGAVSDQTAGALPGVTITVTNLMTGQVRTTTTNELGKYQITALQPAKYSVKAELQGFGSVLRPEVTVNIGSAVDVNMTLAIATVHETVTVSGEAPIIESTKADLSNVIGEQQMQSIPTSSHQYLDFALLLPATVQNVSTNQQGSGFNLGGSRGKEAALLVDGFYNQDEGFALPKQRYSSEAIQEFQVVSFGSAAEYGRAIGGIVNGVTKSGGNQLRGSGYGYFRNQNLTDIDPGLRLAGVPKSDYNRQQWGGTAGGPIQTGKTFFFGAFERIKEDYSFNNGIAPANAAAIGLPSEDVGAVPKLYTLNFAMAKVDHALGEGSQIGASFAMSQWEEWNITSPVAFGSRSRQYDLKATDWSYLLKWQNVKRNGHLLNEAKASFFPRFYSVTGANVGGPPLAAEGQINSFPETNSSPPRVTISSVASFGSASLNDVANTFPTQLLYSSTVYADKHTMKFGTDYMVSYYNYALYSPLVGAYTFSSLANFQAGRYTQYTQGFGETQNNRLHQYFSGYAQDSWQPTNRLTMNYGLRYDFEIQPVSPTGERIGSDFNNFGPRFGLSYDLTGHGTTFAKFAAGIYYDRVFQNETQFYTAIVDHLALQSATWTPATPGAPVYPNVFSSRPANLPAAAVNAWVLPSNYQTPTAGQTVATLEHALRPNLALTVSGVYTRGWNKEWELDTNQVYSDAAHAWLRPSANYRQILQYQYSGTAKYYAGIVELTRRSAVLGFNANLTLAHAYDEGNNYSTIPVDQRTGIAGEYGPQADTPTARAVVSGWYNITSKSQVSGVFQARSGMAVDPVASGLDLNGDGKLNDRTPTFGRNGFRAPGMSQLDLRFTQTVPLGDRKAYFYVEGFNLTNRVNVQTVNNDYGPVPGTPKSTWLVPLTYLPPRQVQLGVRFTF